MASSPSASESAAPLPLDQQRLFGELAQLREAYTRMETRLKELGGLAQLHDAHARIETRLKELVDSHRVIDSFVADLRANEVPSAPRARSEQDESTSPVDRGASESCDVSNNASALKDGAAEEVSGSELVETEDEAKVPARVKGASAFVASNLPLGWPQVLKARHEFSEVIATKSSDAKGKVSIKASRKLSKYAYLSSSAEGSETGWVSRWLVIDPNSKFHMTWTILSLFLLIWDLTALPYVLAWEIEFTGFLGVTSWVTTMFWTIDLIVNFFSAFYSGGELQNKLSAIWRSYTRSWFVTDLVILLCDWFSIIMSETSSAGGDGSRSLKMLRILKIGRLLRILDIMRVLRIVRVIEDFSIMHLSEFTRLGFRLFHLMLGIFWVAHIVACLWFAIGTDGPTDTGARWVETFEVIVDGRTVPLMEAGPSYQYTVSLHWACAQIALGNFDVMPTNSMERLLFICAMLSGFLFGSTLISSLSAAMMDYQMMQKDKTMKLRLLRQYLSENFVDAQLSIQATKQAEQRIAHREALDEKDVSVLQLMSSTLRNHLRYEIQKPVLSRHPIFRLWSSLDSIVVHRICASAVNFVNVRKNDDLFMPGSAVSVAYTVVSGDMSYTQSILSSSTQAESREEVGCQWLCEAALWVRWTTVGHCEAMTACKLLEVHAEELIKGLELDMVIREVGFEYARQFCKRVICACPPHAPYPTDLHVPFTDYCDLVVSMSPRVQVVIGKDALRLLSASGLGRGMKPMDKLWREVQSSKSVLVVDGTGTIIRVVSLIVLRLTNANGEVLTQVGKWSGPEMKGVCQLPGLKQERDESVGEAINRFLETKMPALLGKLEYAGITCENTEHASNEYGVHTRYLRSVCSARLKDSEVLESPICSFQPVQGRTSSARSQRSDKEETAGFDSLKRQFLSSLHAVNVHAVEETSGKSNLFAWLSPEQFSMFGRSPMDRILQTWISSLIIPEPMINTYEAGGVCGGRREHL